MKNKASLFIFIISSIILASCSSSSTPLPYAYFRIDIPSHHYTPVDSLPHFSMTINQIAQIDRSDATITDGADQWYNIHYPTLNANIHLSYKTISPSSFQTISEECRDLAYKHTIRADAITEDYYADSVNNIYGIYYQMEGNAASQAQFFMTDSTRHFLRGSLYFNNPPNADSIAPVASYIQQDIIQLIESISWK